MTEEFKTVEELPPIFGQKGKLYYPTYTLDVIVVRTPFSQEDNDLYWMYRNIRTNEWTWTKILSYDFWCPDD